MTTQFPKATIVIPVYGDWESLNLCINSLKECVTEEAADVILVNDCGPEADILEENIKESIRGHTFMRYYRNDTNLGFVKTCNRAVYELDSTDNDILLLNSDTIVTEGFLSELQSVLYASEKHGTVCPRSNNATIATVPFMNIDNTDDRNLEHSKKVYDSISGQLPRYQVVPVVIGFCMLIKRKLIQNFGLFDEVYRLGYGEECDFCQRINQYGYSSVIANHAYVYHLESRSFTSEKKAKMMELNEKVLHKRYPYYVELVQRFIRDYMDPVDWFADTIAGGHQQKKVLINLAHLPTVYNGTSRNALTFLKYLQKNRDNFKNLRFTVVANESAIRYFKLRDFGMEIKRPQDINELYHLGYCPSQIFSLDILLLMNRYCQKIVFSLLDIIALRSNVLLSSDYMQKMVFEDSIRIADKIITISNFSKEDTTQYFNLQQKDIKKIEVIHQGNAKSGGFDEVRDSRNDQTAREIAANKDYILVVGNEYKFKLLKEVINALKTMDYHLVILGYSGKNLQRPNIQTIPAGSISDASLDLLRKKSKAIVFPSLYEGFGLPILEAVNAGKPVVVSKTAINEEIKRLCGNLDQIVVFEKLNTLTEAVNKALDMRVSGKAVSVRSIDEYNEDVMETLLKVLNEDQDIESLRKRWSYFAHISTYLSSRKANDINRRSIVHATADTLRTYTPSIYRLTRHYYRKLLKKK